MTPLQIEQRAAEIVAAMATKYVKGGWFACMTRDEQRGWNMHEDEWYYGDTAENTAERTPTNSRMWVGWLAREIVFPFNYDPRLAFGPPLGIVDADVRAGGAK